MEHLYYLVLVQLTVLVLLLSLLLKSDDDETNEDVHHEESDDDDVDNEENRDLHPVVINGPHIFHMGINGSVQQSKKRREPKTDTKGTSRSP